jgi:hypothetical protein
MWRVMGGTCGSWLGWSFAEEAEVGIGGVEEGYEVIEGGQRMEKVELGVDVGGDDGREVFARDGVVDTLEYQCRGGASACILPVIRSESTRYHSHILNIDTLWTDISLIVISSKVLALRPIYAQDHPSPPQRPFPHVVFHLGST